MYSYQILKIIYDYHSVYYNDHLLIMVKNGIIFYPLQRII